MHNNNTTTNPLIQSLGYNNSNYYIDNCHFALCKLCFWSATIFKSDLQEHKTNTCPVCLNDNSVSLIPLTTDDVYELSSRSKGGLEMKFSKIAKAYDNICI
jgi:hypothetical protein